MKKFIFAFVLLAVVASCSSSDDSEPLNNTDNSGTTTDNDGGGSEGPLVDTAYFYSNSINSSYISYDSLFRYSTENLYAKLSDSSIIYLGYYFIKRDLASNIVWKHQSVYSEVYLCDNRLSVICSFSYYSDAQDDLLDNFDTYSGWCLFDQEGGQYINHQKTSEGINMDGSFKTFTPSIVCYNDDDYFLNNHALDDEQADIYFYILDGKTGIIKNTFTDKEFFIGGIIDYSCDGYIVTRATEQFGQIGTYIRIYINDLFGNDDCYSSLLLSISGNVSDIFYPYNCEVESVEISGTNIIYTLALATPPEGSDYPAYSKAVVTVSLETKSITEWEGIY